MNDTIADYKVDKYHVTTIFSGQSTYLGYGWTDKGVQAIIDENESILISQYESGDLSTFDLFKL